MTTIQEFKDQLKSISSALGKIHKTIMEHEMELLETKRQTKLSSGDRLNLLLNDPDLAWLRAISQQMTAIDEVYFQKEPIQIDQVSKLKNEVQALMFQSSDSVFSKKYRSLLPILPDLMPQHGLLKVAMSSKDKSN